VVLDPKNRHGLPAGDAKFLEIVEKFGWHVMTVAPRTGEEGDLFAYSTGLYYSFGHPEILLFNLELDAFTGVINTIGQRVKAGEKFEAGPAYSGVFNGYPCTFRPVATTHYAEYVGFSLWFYEGTGFPLLQGFWPDRLQHFPWEPACEEATRNSQPLLYLNNGPLIQ
jgi:hypothetical protein